MPCSVILRAVGNETLGRYLVYQLAIEPVSAHAWVDCQQFGRIGLKASVGIGHRTGSVGKRTEVRLFFAVIVVVSWQFQTEIFVVSRFVMVCHVFLGHLNMNLNK